MITNSKPWQAVVNQAGMMPVSNVENKLEVVKNNAATSKQPSIKMQVVNPKRYSFDDNGGGYEGL